MREAREQFGASQGEQPSSEQEKRARFISRYVERVIAANECLSREEEQELQEYYANLRPREKADIFYEKLMAYTADKKATRMQGKVAEDRSENQELIDPYLVSEIKVLFDDAEVRRLISTTYGEARVDAKKLRLSELGKLWKHTAEDIRIKESSYKLLEQNLHLSKISGTGAISSAKSRMARLAENISALEKRKRNIETLRGFPKTAENTDLAAYFQYQKLREYKEQLKAGFVWLPSRINIHQKTVSAILNHRWPVLIGEAGSGKSDQADAAALELTGHMPTEIECESTTGESNLIKDIAIDPDTGGSYEVYGPLMQAFTGHEDSRQEKPSTATGRIARFDESGRLGPMAYSIIKKARQKKAGDDFYGRRMLPGAAAIWTSNPVGPRYPNRHALDPAMRRELSEIYVDYPEMSVSDPELYEFALAALEDENYHIAVAQTELAPAYEKIDIPEDRREILEDGSIVVGEDQIVTNMADRRHGALWRFTAAVKTLQDSFVNGNAEIEKYPDTLLRFKEDTAGNIDIATDGSGEPLTLSTSTVTLGELGSWLKGFNERRQKQDEDFRVETLTEWLNFKINSYLEQADKADKEKLRSIFRHFGFLDQSIVPDLGDAKPLTPKAIGYLSPRTPRPVYLERPFASESIEAPAPRPEIKDVKEYKTKQVLLEDEASVLMKVSEFTIENGRFDLQTKKLVPLEITVSKRFMVKGKIFTLAGVVEDKTSIYNGWPIGQFASGEKIYKIFSSQELDWGIENEFKDLGGETGSDDMRADLLDYWESEECEKASGEFIF